MEMIENLIDRRMNNAQFGVTFFTSSQRQDTCGTNGLPLTPNSIRILGRSQYLKSLSHPNISQYIDTIRGKHERIILVLEHYSTNLRKLLKEKDSRLIGNPHKILQFAKNVLKGLCYLNQHGIVSRNLCLDNILFDGNDQVKLFNFGLYYMTNNGKYVSFPIGHPKYTSPEVVLSGVFKGPAIPSFDVWSLGIILVELILGEELWPELKLSQTIRKVASLTHCESGNGGGVLPRLFQEHHSLDILKDLNPKLKNLIEQCLEINATKRSCPKDLLKEIFDSNSEFILSQTVILSEDLLETQQYNVPPKLSKFFRSAMLTPDFKKNIIIEENDSTTTTITTTETTTATTTNDTNIITNQNESPKKTTIEQSQLDGETNQTNGGDGSSIGNSNGTLALFKTDHLSQRSLKEVYYLWQLAGGDVFAELKRQGLTRKKPAILSLPSSMTLEGESAGKNKERGLLLDQTVIILPLNELRKRLSDIPPEEYYPLIETKMDNLRPNVIAESSLLPLIIREKDIEYQFHRILLFDRLIKGYPYTKSIIHRESLLDIPPFFRAQIWSCLLEIEGDHEGIYNAIDKETPTSTDRQIEVDIPRCHQYDELLSSATGHEKFKRVLKAWVVSNTKYVYWQGLDSLCAPFLYLNFNDEAMAYACLSAFIPKYLYNFFLKDNSMIIQEYLAKFSQLIAFHDPLLTNHLDSIGFIPELYAIPWFLTMFSHVFPLHKIFHLWDKLLLSDSSFSLCIGLAILYQLRDSLLSSGFNECILLFSDMPEINIERCVKDSVEIYCSTPKSSLCRKHEPPSQPKRSVNSSSSRSASISSYDDYTGNSRSSFSSDTRNTSNDALKMEAISLDDLKREKCSRISGEDFLNLLDLNQTKFSKPKLVVVDVRNHEDYNRGAIPTSINMPYSTSFAPDGSLVASPEANVLNSNRGKIIVVVGNRGDSAVKFAEAILRLEYPRICVLNRGRHNYEELYREILSLKESKAELERSRDEAISRSRDLELKYQDVLLELKQLNVSDNNKISDLECQVKVKTYELDRCSLLLAEVEAKYKRECEEKEKLRRKVESLREELTHVQTHSQKVICSLKLQLQDKSVKLDSYEKLEIELDKIIMRTANMPNHDDAEKILLTYEKEAFIPLNSKRRLQQCLNLARRILELENHASELKTDLFRERDLKKELQDELTATKACLLHVDHPTSELIDLLLKRNLEMGKLKNKITVLENDIMKLRQTEHQLKKELTQLSEHGEELISIKKMISDLQQPISVASKLAASKTKKSQKSPSSSTIITMDKDNKERCIKTKTSSSKFSKGDEPFMIPESHSNYNNMISSRKKLIHIKKPITFSKVSRSSLSEKIL